MPKLVIVESPAKANTINKLLGKEFSVHASMGHVRDLPQKRMGVDTEKDFAPEYGIIPGREKTVRELRKAAKDAPEVFLATDLDREGEAIAWHLAQALNLADDKLRRVIFNQITPRAIRQAFAHPLTINLDKVNAQQARRILDRIVGYRLSPLLWRKVSKGLSAGRVQSVAVKLICDRERELQEFVPEEYWRIIARLSPQKHKRGEPKEFEAELKKFEGKKIGLENQARTQEIVDKLKDADYLVSKVTKKERSQSAPPPYITSTLQQQASIQLHFTTRRTMRVAQQLYEGVELGGEGAAGLITYMRTDSFRVADEALKACREFIQEHYDPELLPDKPNFFRSRKGAQAAHEAIRPAAVERTPDQVKGFLSRDQHRLYELIWKRFVASQMKPAVYLVTDAEIEAGRGLFTAQGKRLIFPGHLTVTGRNRKEDERPLPSLEETQPLDLEELTPSQHFTQPPPRYTEAALVRALERLGIGRPSTYAPISATIQQRKYVRLEKRQFHATELGMHVTDILVASFPDIINVEFTSQMEEKLDQIEESHADWVKILHEFYAAFSKDLERANKEKKEVVMTEEKCEKCGKPMAIRWSRHGRFMGCSGFPECRSTKPMDEPEDKDKAAPGEAGEQPAAPPATCEKCGKPMVLRSGPRGKFYGCSGYPECKSTRPVDGKSTRRPPEPTDIDCEKCGKKMVIRTGRRGRFLGCSGYPKCRNTMSLPDDLAEKSQKQE